MSNCLLIIFVILLSVALKEFPSRFLKCSFHIWIDSSWLTVFSLAPKVLFLLLTSLTVCYTIQVVYLLLSFLFYWSNLECIIFVLLVCTILFPKCLLKFLVLDFFYYIGILFSLCLIFFELLMSPTKLCLVLGLVGMHSVAVSMWLLMNFLFSLLGVSVLDIS